MDNQNNYTNDSLRSGLNYQPQILCFGTSGRRGEVVHLTQLEIYINALAEMQYLLSLPAEQGGISAGDEFFYAYDLRPSSSGLVAEHGGRGELAQAIEQAIGDAGMQPVNLGRIPTPALAFYALARRKGSMMITGSHIPFDRNGYKTYSAKGELLKKDETPIDAMVQVIRQRLYSQPLSESAFGPDGMFKTGSRRLLPERIDAGEAYLKRYTDFFPPQGLQGMRLLAYQHSAVGRDLLVEVLQRMGAEVVPAGRSECFVAIDTEAIDDRQLQAIQALADENIARHGRFDAIVSTDGDSDRPLILALNKRDDGFEAKFFGGDLVGMIVAEYLRADAVILPISCNDAIDRGALKDKLEPRTRIGSPCVIEGMNAAGKKGRRAVCGWEANGGFLTGSDIHRNGKTLTALPTRDAVLPILCVLLSAREAGLSISQRFALLPDRFSRASLLRQFPRHASRKIIQRFSPVDATIIDVHFDHAGVTAMNAAGTPVAASAEAMQGIRYGLRQFFPTTRGFGQIKRLNYIDGIRIFFDNGDVAHIRPSGTAEELRIYAVSDTQQRAEEIAAMGIREPDGILRQLEKATAATS